MKQIITGMDLGKLLLEAGLIPPNSGDVIIECPVGGPVILHCIALGDERMLAVFSAAVKGAKIVTKRKPKVASPRAAIH